MSKQFVVPDLEVEIEVAGKTYALDLGEVATLMRIDADNIEEELEEQAAFYFWVGTLASSAETNAEEAKQSFDIFYAELQKQIRDEMESEGGKAPAAATVEAAAKSKKEYKKRQEEMMETRRVASLASVVRDAVRMRQYTLIERSRRLSRREAAETEE